MSRATPILRYRFNRQHSDGFLCAYPGCREVTQSSSSFCQLHAKSLETDLARQERGECVVLQYGKLDKVGNKVCCYCGKAVPSKRHSWCSDECVNQYRGKTDWQFIRNKVAQRDNGICAICGRDTKLMDEVKRHMLNTLKKRGAYRHREWRKFLIRWGANRVGDLWDADHIKPVCEGGTNDLGNLRTLCILCHKAETARLAGARAQGITLREMKELNMSEKKEGKIETRKIYRREKVILTDKELLDCGDELSKALGEADRLEDVLNDIKAQFKGDISRQAEIARRNQGLLERKYEFREVECREEKDFGTKKIKIVRLDTGEVIENRKLRPEELQAVMFSEKEEVSA